MHQKISNTNNNKKFLEKCGFGNNPPPLLDFFQQQKKVNFLGEWLPLKESLKPTSGFCSGKHSAASCSVFEPKSLTNSAKAFVCLEKNSHWRFLGKYFPNTHAVFLLFVPDIKRLQLVVVLMSDNVVITDLQISKFFPVQQEIWIGSIY